MKFEELRKIAVVVDMSPRTAPYSATGEVYKGPGTVPCVKCGYKPLGDASALSSEGVCSVCSYRVRQETKLEEVFGAGTPKECRGCNQTYFGGLDPHNGLCTVCRVREMDTNNKRARSEAASQVMVFGAYFCHGCSRYGAVMPGGTCPECKNKPTGLYACHMCGEFRSKEMGRKCSDCKNRMDNPTPKPTVLQKFMCRDCKQIQAFVTGGTCLECIDRKEKLSRPPYKDERPRLIRYLPQAGGGWIEKVTIIGEGRKMSMEEKLGTDGRLGASGVM